MRKVIYLLITFSVLAVNTVYATSENLFEHVVWKKIPISITLPVDKERILTFPAIVKFGYDKNKLPPDTLKVINANQTLYLKALKPFEIQRVQIALDDNSGTLIQIDIKAVTGASSTPIEVVLADTNPLQANPASIEQPAQTVSYIELARYAVQQLYAPKRLLTNSPVISRVPMHSKRIIPLYRGDAVIAMPLASWSAGNSYVTAILLRNKQSFPLSLTPYDIRGNWVSAAFYPLTQLGEAGSREDTTTVFLISKRPFAETLQL